MNPPPLRGEVDRRLLVNYRVDPEVASRHLPAPFRPQLHGGHAVAGICLIRLGGMRPPGWPERWGLRSENAAHRFAVEWDDGEVGVRTGVYIPRRDSDSLLNVLVGGRLFPGAHHRADFTVEESDDAVSVGFRARDGSAEVHVEVETAPDLGGSALFGSLEEASLFFEQGSLGWSATASPGRYDGLRLVTSAWSVEPVRVTRSSSSFFDDPGLFPPGTAVLDDALLMRRVPVRWEAVTPLRAAVAGAGS